MRGNTKDFNQSCVNTVRAQAALIPAVVFAQTGTTKDILGTLKDVLTAFYSNPTTANYGVVLGAYWTFPKSESEFFHDHFFMDLRYACRQALTSLGEPFAQKVFADAKAQSTSLPVIDNALRLVAQKRAPR